MFRFLSAGLLAGCLQTLVVATATLAMLWRSGISAVALEGSSILAGLSVGARSRNLALVYILGALLVTLVRTPSIRSTAHNFRSGFRNISPKNPEDAANTLLVPIIVAAAGCGILSVKNAPSVLIHAGLFTENSTCADVAWPALLSVAGAAFGATAHAILLARDLP